MGKIRLETGALDAHDLSEVERLFEACFERPPPPDFRERVAEKLGVLLIVAESSRGHIGFKLGYEQNRHAFYSWLGGVDPTGRRAGVARALLQRQHEWLTQNGYESVETEAVNQATPMILLNLQEGFHVVGTHIHSSGTLRVRMRKQLVPPRPA